MAVVSVADPERPVSLDMLVEQFSADDSAPAPRRGPAWGKIAGVGLALHPDARLALHAARRVRYRRARARVGARHAARGGRRQRSCLPTCLQRSSCFRVRSSPSSRSSRSALARFRRRDERRCAVRHLPLLPRPLDEARHHSAHRGRGPNRMTKLLRRHGLSASFACSIAPVAPFIAVGMVAGAMRVKLWHYLAGMLAGMLPERSPRRSSPTSSRPRSRIPAASTGGWWRASCWCSPPCWSPRGAALKRLEA